jgi:coenzyme F420-reducing hydrogenase delta subunit
MANAYLTLKETRNAIMNFKKGAEEFKREREFLNQKSTRTDIDNQRIEMLNRELQNLKRFKEKLN